MTDPLFFAPQRVMTAAAIADLTGAKLANPAYENVEITGIAAAGSSRDGMLVFVEGRKNAGMLNGLRAAAVFCTPDIVSQVPVGIAALVTPRPQLAFSQTARLIYPTAFSPEPITGEFGISARAYVAANARVEEGVTVEAGAVIGAGVSVGAGTIIGPNAVIGPHCQIGRNSYVGPGASILNALLGDKVIVHAGACIGQAGFGFVGGPRGPEPTPQIGRVVIQDNVEIGANTTVDRGALGDTIIGESTKIDNLVQIAHNVRIGRGCLIAGYCGLSGSVTLGDYVMLGGRVGISDHVTIGSGSQIAASSGIMTDVPAGERWGGSPAQPLRKFFREIAAIRRLSMENPGKGEDND